MKVAAVLPSAGHAFSHHQEQFLELLRGRLDAARAAGGHTAILVEVRVANGQVRAAEIKHVERWQPGGRPPG